VRLRPPAGRVRPRDAVWNIPAEVDLDRGHAAIPDGEDLRIAEAVAGARQDLVGDEYPLAVGDRICEFEVLKAVSVRPADLEVPAAIQPVVPGAEETEVVGNQPFRRGAVLRLEGFVERTRGRDVFCRAIRRSLPAARF
jgi:hypothetical protein